ncbi:MAG: lamin tail domain-containing protein [Myxococcales bacterium]|nr:lamin tail domain-containing protein [Myxococcales bacterium]
MYFLGRSPFLLLLALVCTTLGCTSRSTRSNDNPVMDGGSGNMDGGGTVCGDGVCEFAAGEGCMNCPTDCSKEATCMGDARCGDGVCEMDRGESCDLCVADCSTLPACVAGACGDGKKMADEECDDGNFDSFDGCSSKCVIEDAYECDGEPSVCGRPAAVAGELVITEIMANPKAVSDASGEWIEIQNTSSDTITLKGLGVQFKSGAVNQSFTIATVLLLEPNEYAILANNGDKATNGGVDIDYKYIGVGLEDSGTLTLSQGGTTEIDKVTYGVGETTVVEGRTVSLDPTKVDYEMNDLPASWCPSPLDGTPGAVNGACNLKVLAGTNSSAIAIPDKDPVGVSRTLVVNDDTCTVLAIAVGVDITHTYKGHLTVSITGPNGATALLHEKTGGSTDDLKESYPVPTPPKQPLTIYNGINAKTDWVLTVTSTGTSTIVDTGTLNSWNLKIICAP